MADLTYHPLGRAHKAKGPTAKARAKRRRAEAPIKRTVLHMTCERKDRAVAVLFAAGYEAWEVGALLRKSVGMVNHILRKRIVK